MTDTGAAEQRQSQPQHVYDSIAEMLLYGTMVGDNQIILAPTDYEGNLVEKTGIRPGEDRGWQDWGVPLAVSFLTVAALASGTAGVAAAGGRAAVWAAGRAGFGKLLPHLPIGRMAGLDKLALKAGFGSLPVVGAVLGGMLGGHGEKSEEELKAEVEKQLKEELSGSTEIRGETPITEGGFGLADYAILAEQAGLNQNNFRTQMPLFYGNIKLTDKGMFAASEAADVAGQAIIEGMGDQAELAQYMVPPLASSAGRTLGAMTVRWYDIYAPISEYTVQAGTGSVQQPGRGVQGETYKESRIGDEQIIGRRMLAPGEEMPEAPLGRRYEEDEAEMDYGIDDALAYYDALTPEQQKEFATGLVALGYMGAGKETQSTLDVEWLVNPDDALQRESVAVALANVASAQNARMVAELGEGAAASGMDTANPLRNQYLPILGLEGGLFDTEEAKISDWDSFVREAQQTAGYLKTVDTRYITKATNDWAFRVYGRSATPDEIAVALNGAAALAEATPVGAGANQRLSDASLAVGAVAGIPIDQEEASQNATALINSAIGNYIMRNSRGLM